MLSLESQEDKDRLGSPKIVAVNAVGYGLSLVLVLLGGDGSTEEPCCACLERRAGRRAQPFIFCFVLATRSVDTTRGGGKSASPSISKSSGQRGPWQVRSQRLSLKLKVFIDTYSSLLPPLSLGVPSLEGLPPLSSSRIPPIFVLLASWLPRVIPLSVASIRACKKVPVGFAAVSASYTRHCQPMQHLVMTLQDR